jgi:hypothetical protein
MQFSSRVVFFMFQIVALLFSASPALSQSREQVIIAGAGEEAMLFQENGVSP